MVEYVLKIFVSLIMQMWKASERSLKYLFLLSCRCGKLLKGELEVQAHAMKTQHSSFSESTEEIKPLTAEEKKEQLDRFVNPFNTE